MLFLTNPSAYVDEVELVHDYESTFRAHHGRLVRALTVVAGSREAAADAVQEAFVKAHFRWRTISRYDDPVGWIRRVAINKLRDEHRRNTRKQRAMLRLGNEREDLGSDPDIDGIAPLLAGLPKQQKACIAFFYVDGLSVAEIAATMKLSEGAVKFHLHQGRERLRATLEHERHDP